MGFLSSHNTHISLQYRNDNIRCGEHKEIVLNAGNEGKSYSDEIGDFPVNETSIFR